MKCMVYTKKKNILKLLVQDLLITYCNKGQERGNLLEFLAVCMLIKESQTFLKGTYYFNTKIERKIKVRFLLTGLKNKLIKIIE